MVGGGRGSQIGYIHRSAALRDNSFALVAGAFDLDPERGRTFGVDLHVAPERCYPDYRTMFASRGAAFGRDPSGVDRHAQQHALRDLPRRAGVRLHVICEKPLCFTIAEAEALRDLAVARNRVVGVTYGYAGHQLIEQAHRMIVAGELGEIRIVQMQFAHGFHSEAVEEANPSTRWRVDPKFAGPSYVLGDIGTHPLYLSEVMLPDLRIRRLLCSRQSFVKSRAPLEDNAFTIMEYDSGAIGYVWSSAVNAGSMHGQKIRVIGATASIEWWDERPNQLSYEIQGRPAQILERGMGYLHAAATRRRSDRRRTSRGIVRGLVQSLLPLRARHGRSRSRRCRGSRCHPLS